MEARKRVHDLHALTPDFIRARPNALEALRIENKRLRAELSYEKKKHELIENVLSRKFGDLQKTLSRSQESIDALSAEVIKQLGQELILRGRLQ